MAEFIQHERKFNSYAEIFGKFVMVQKLAKYVEKLRKLTSNCKRKVKKEFRTWKAFYLNLAVNILVHLLSRRRGSSVSNSPLFTLPTSDSFLDFLRVWSMSYSLL